MNGSEAHRTIARNPHYLFAMLAAFILSSIAALPTSRPQAHMANSSQDPHPAVHHSAPCDTRSNFLECRKAAASGDVKAMYALGCLYEHGEGTEKDLSKAWYWYRRSAHAGSIQGMNRLGEMYRDGDGVARDYDKAKFWWSKATRSGNSGAMNNLGMLYSYQRGFPSSYSVALDWFRRSAKRGNSEAMNNLGMMYSEARGVTRDYVKARHWFERSVERKNSSAMVDLGYLYEKGLGVPKDLGKAIQLYESAASAGNAQAPEMLGLLYKNGLGVPKDLEKARENFEKAADLNDVGAMYELGELYEGVSGYPRDAAKAKYWYERTASRADHAQANQWEIDWAMERLGASYEAGLFTERDYQLAMEWYRKTLAFDSPNAMDRIAYLYSQGLGIAKNEAEAETWRAKAAALRPPPKLLTPGCSDQDLETKLRVFDTRAYHIVAVERRNTAKAACMLGNYTLRPNQVAHSSRRWKTLSDDGTTTGCHDDMNNSFLGGITLVSSTLLPQVCSEVESSNYAAGTFTPDWPPENKGVLRTEPKLVLSATKAQYMNGEYVPLHVTVADTDAAKPQTKQGCPVLLRSIAYPTGSVRIDEMTPAVPEPGFDFETVINCRNAKARGTALSEFDFDGTLYLDEKTSNTVRFFTLAGTSSQGEIRFVESNSITVNFKDPTDLPRTWGPIEQGVHVSLSLDKLTYAVGEDIPLHIGAQVVSSDRPVYAHPDVMTNSLSFAGAFHLTILGEDGVRTGNEEPANLEERWLRIGGPVFCPSPLVTGHVYALERSAKRLGLLPRQPGTYRMFVTWSPFPASDPPCNELSRVAAGKTFQPFDTVSSAPLTIQITGKPIVESGVPDVPVYKGWKEHFRVVDTPLGEATALEDLRSHLQWLRLTQDKEQSIDSLRRQMAPQGRLAGWRFATRSELLTLFANFTGSADGQSADPGIERALQHLLGGPFDTPRNLDTGWSRRATHAVVAEVRPAKPEETPAHPAVAPPCAGCGAGFMTWLAYIGEDTSGGNINATVDPGGEGWSVSNQGVMPGLDSAILLVRNSP